MLSILKFQFNLIESDISLSILVFSSIADREYGQQNILRSANMGSKTF